MVAVTGATGHVGNVLVRELVGRGQKVRAVVLPLETTEAIAGLDVEVVRELGYAHRPLNQTIRDSIEWFAATGRLQLKLPDAGTSVVP